MKITYKQIGKLGIFLFIILFSTSCKEKTNLELNDVVQAEVIVTTTSNPQEIQQNKTTSTPIPTTKPTTKKKKASTKKKKTTYLLPEHLRYNGNLETLDKTSLNWGQGVSVDEKNRPIGSTSYEEKYGKYCADFIKQPKKEGKKIYLTIDEGYENGYTSKLLDILKEKECPAVFFVTMPYVKENPDLIKRMIKEGHVVGNHSVTHPVNGLPSLSIANQKEELTQLHQYMLDNFNYEMYLFRYPAGIFSEQSLAVISSTGYRSVFWSFAYQDWLVDNQPEPTVALQKLKEKIHPGAIYLLHAVSKTNTEIIGDFIEQIRKEGYTFAKYT